MFFSDGAAGFPLSPVLCCTKTSTAEFIHRVQRDEPLELKFEFSCSQFAMCFKQETSAALPLFSLLNSMFNRGRHYLLNQQPIWTLKGKSRPSPSLTVTVERGISTVCLDSSVDFWWSHFKKFDNRRYTSCINSNAVFSHRPAWNKSWSDLSWYMLLCQYGFAFNTTEILWNFKGLALFS